jgi:ankyrin repeat protein
LLWASCNGNEEIVRLLVSKGACDPYISKDTTEGKEEDLDAFRKPEDAKKIGKYTPLHWASYKGFHKIVWILLYKGLNPLKVDQYGNTAVHQACAAGNLEVLKVFLAKGVNVKKTNGRIHTPMDLATEPETKKLLQLAKNTKFC